MEHLYGAVFRVNVLDWYGRELLAREFESLESAKKFAQDIQKRAQEKYETDSEWKKYKKIIIKKCFLDEYGNFEKTIFKDGYDVRYYDMSLESIKAYYDSLPDDDPRKILNKLKYG